MREDPPTDRFSPISVIVCSFAYVALEGLSQTLVVAG